MSASKPLTAVAVALTGAALIAWAQPDRDLTSTLEYGNPGMETVGAMAFGPEGILFVGDPRGAAVYALDVEDDGLDTGSTPIALDNIDRRVAGALGTTASEITIHDLAVHPESQNVYLSVSRGAGEDAIGAIVRVTKREEIEAVDLTHIAFSRVEIRNAPDADAVVRRQPARTFTVTDVAYLDGQVYVAGLSNEEFASHLRRIPFPFSGEMTSTSLEIYHVSHGQDETHAPVQTFAPLQVDGRNYIVAAYTCTPLVTFGVDDLQDGEHVVGRTVAELGAGNRPLDIVPYTFEGKDQLLIANSRHPLMRVDASVLNGAANLEHPTQDTGVPFTNVHETGIVQLSDLNADYVVAIEAEGDALHLRSLSKHSL